MATYYVWSGATGTNAGTSWTNAYTSFASAVTAATAAGDIIKVHYTHQQNLSASATYTFNAADVRILSVNKDSSDAITEMGTNGWIGSNTTAYAITLNGTTRRIYVYGITFRHSGSASANINISSGNNSHFVLENVRFQIETTGTCDLTVGPSSATNSGYAEFINCTIKLGATSQRIYARSGEIVFNKCVLDSSGSSPTSLFVNGANGDALTCVGCDWSACTNQLVLEDLGSRTYYFSQCKLGANVVILTTALYGNKSRVAVAVFDCSSGDTHGLVSYYDDFGSCVSDTGIFYTSGAAGQAWKITTTGDCSSYTPFTSPFVDFYNTGTSSITPYFEILRDGSTTAYQNDEVWGEFFVKTTSGSTQSTPYNDRMALLGTPADQAAGAGTGSWTGEAASAWSGKIDSGSAVTPAENGHIRGRVVVGEPSITVYVDPQIRT